MAPSTAAVRAILDIDNPRRASLYEQGCCFRLRLLLLSVLRLRSLARATGDGVRAAVVVRGFALLELAGILRALISLVQRIMGADCRVDLPGCMRTSRSDHSSIPSCPPFERCSRERGWFDQTLDRRMHTLLRFAVRVLRRRRERERARAVLGRDRCTWRASRIESLRTICMRGLGYLISRRRIGEVCGLYACLLTKAAVEKVEAAGIASLFDRFNGHRAKSDIPQIL
ncbi:hypothetical protein CALVIDRAFT_82917 [Calocera viscosa TUFC12733]|uniref:Uncharacterized protein n=1 Tax=Calocera viscosa (strain TUFC12733) TaxID=1330018 RepID=A0A167N3F2_CALVF|nr:hypothetical protein CALVIDRAFT_82917 [Calocera viscosa TUFC12733]